MKSGGEPETRIILTNDVAPDIVFRVIPTGGSAKTATVSVYRANDPNQAQIAFFPVDATMDQRELLSVVIDACRLFAYGYDAIRPTT